MQLERDLQELRKTAKQNPIPAQAFAILHRWREEKARSLPKWEAVITYTKGDANARPK